MNEKSLIYSLFSKFLDEGQDEIPREEDGKESPEREQDKKSRPQGQPYDRADETEHIFNLNIICCAVNCNS